MPRGQDNPGDLPEATIDTIVETLYASISFGPGGQPDWERLTTVFAPRARLVQVRSSSIVVLEVQTFLQRLRAQVKARLLQQFREVEMARRVDRYGCIAQVFSTFDARYGPEDPGQPVRGISSIQLYYDERRWWINSILWEEESSQQPIPIRYLSRRNLTETDG